MGNLCCQKPEDDLVLETFQSAEKINAINENIIERDLNVVKDKYPHDSDSAFRKINNGGKEMINTMKYQNGQQEVINEIGEDINIVN